MSERSVAPGLLLAMPQLPDPNFTRSVVLMVEHTHAGSWGLVVNRPMTVLVAEVLDQLEIEWEGSPDSVVWSGGPVEPQRGCVLHEPLDAPHLDEALSIVPGISLSTHPLQLQSLARRPPRQLRFLLGYAGWGPGQLELELAQGSWLLAGAGADLVFETAPERMWEAAIQSLGIEPATLVPGTGIH